MMIQMKRLIFLLFFVLFLSFASKTYAIYNPTLLPNNIVGVHVIDENDIPSATKMVNSYGDWGYITLVITEDNRNTEKWSGIFTQLKENHLIPIVRVATKGEGSSWRAPKEVDASGWADFLNSLPWPVENRYVILFNEPNHASEWGNTTNPAAYANVSDTFITNLKEKSKDFFILPAGLDLYAPNSQSTMDAVTYWDGMELVVPGILKRFDGWTSHSYPPGNFTGSPTTTGRHSIVAYKWELGELSHKYGIRSTLPVFITETGWGESSGLSRDTIAEYYETAFADIWGQDHQIVAVTPFLLNYQDGLFSRFSFKKRDSDEFYPQFAKISSLLKAQGEPLTKATSKFGELLNKLRRDKLAQLQASL